MLKLQQQRRHALTWQNNHSNTLTTTTAPLPALYASIIFISAIFIALLIN